MYKFNKNILVYLIFLLSGGVKAETINVVAPHWEDYTNIDGSGIYFELIKHVYSDELLSLDVTELPRAKNQFLHNKVDILIGVYKEELPQAYYSNWYLDTDAPVVAFYLQDNKSKINITLDFKNAYIAWMEGFNFEKLFEEKITPYIIKQRKTGFKLLIHKRIDYFIDYKDNITSEYLDLISFVTLIKGKKLYLAFQNNSKGIKLAEHYDKMMVKLRAEGKLELIFGKDYIPSGHKKFQLDIEQP